MLNGSEILNALSLVLTAVIILIALGNEIWSPQESFLNVIARVFPPIAHTSANLIVFYKRVVFNRSIDHITEVIIVSSKHVFKKEQNWKSYLLYTIKTFKRNINEVKFRLKTLQNIRVSGSEEHFRYMIT